MYCSDFCPYYFQKPSEYFKILGHCFDLPQFTLNTGECGNYELIIAIIYVLIRNILEVEKNFYNYFSFLDAACINLVFLVLIKLQCMLSMASSVGFVLIFQVIFCNNSKAACWSICIFFHLTCASYNGI